VRERVPEAILYERSLASTRRERDRSLSGEVVVRAKHRRWERADNSRVAPYLRAARVAGEEAATVLDDWSVYLFEVNGDLGPVDQSEGLVILVVSGTGYSLVDGERFNWAPGDVIVAPHREVNRLAVHHVSDDPEHPAQWVVFANQSVVEWAAATPVLEHAANGRADRNGRGRSTSRVPRTYVDQLRAHGEVARERHQRGVMVVHGSNEPWGLSRQAFIKRYMWTPWAIQVPAETPCDDWRVFINDIKVHSGQHKHQGGLLIYVVEGEGYSVVEGEQHDWESGDLLLLPFKPGGVEHQHFNRYEGKPAKWIAFINSAVHSWGASDMVQLKVHPEFREEMLKVGR
jgi:quercetin dioxygenase-like cupin family protein